MHSLLRDSPFLYISHLYHWCVVNLYLKASTFVSSLNPACNSNVNADMATVLRIRLIRAICHASLQSSSHTIYEITYGRKSDKLSMFRLTYIINLNQGPAVAGPYELAQPIVLYIYIYIYILFLLCYSPSYSRLRRVIAHIFRNDDHCVLLYIGHSKFVTLMKIFKVIWKLLICYMSELI